jgi:DNA transposition AAA+ family ATPase
MTGGFVEINAVRVIRAAMDRALKWPYPARVISKPGMGKTTALLHFAQEFEAVYCTVQARYKDTAGVYLMLMAAYELVPDKESARDHARQLYSELPQLDYACCCPLVVDEYQTLEATALRELLNIVAECKIPLVLVGNGERLAKERKDERPALEQIWNRVRPTYRIDPPDFEDCRAFAIEFDVECKQPTYAALAAYGVKTSVRDLVCLLQEAREVRGAGVITLEDIRTAVLTIHGRRDALKLLQSDQAA